MKLVVLQQLSLALEHWRANKISKGIDGSFKPPTMKFIWEISDNMFITFIA